MTIYDNAPGRPAEIVLEQPYNREQERAGYRIRKVYEMVYLDRDGNEFEGKLQAGSIEPLVSNWAMFCEHHTLVKQRQGSK